MASLYTQLTTVIPRMLLARDPATLKALDSALGAARNDDVCIDWHLLQGDRCSYGRGAVSQHLTQGLYCFMGRSTGISTVSPSLVLTLTNEVME